MDPGADLPEHEDPQVVVQQIDWVKGAHAHEELRELLEGADHSDEDAALLDPERPESPTGPPPRQVEQEGHGPGEPKMNTLVAAWDDPDEPAQLVPEPAGVREHDHPREESPKREGHSRKPAASYARARIGHRLSRRRKAT